MLERFEVVYERLIHEVKIRLKSNNAETVVKTLLNHWIVKFRPSIYLVNDRGSQYFNTDMAQRYIVDAFSQFVVTVPIG